jgi:hypothetical protein
MRSSGSIQFKFKLSYPVYFEVSTKTKFIPAGYIRLYPTRSSTKKLQMASPRTRRVLKEIKPKEDNNVRFIKLSTITY